MHIICNQSILSDSLNIAIKGVSTKSTLKILECFLLKADETGFSILSNDLEIGIQISNLEVDILEYGEITIDARIFYDIIKKFNEKTLNIKLENNNIVNISCENANFELIGMSSDEFPPLPIVTTQSKEKYMINAIDFKNMIQKTIFSVGMDQSKPATTGVLIELKDDYINLVTVDGFRVSHSKQECKTNNNDFSLIVPAKTLREIAKIIPNEEDLEISFYEDERHIIFEFDNIVIVSRLIEGQFINYVDLFMPEYKTIYQVKRELVVDSIERAILITSRYNKKNPIKLEISKKTFVITSNTEIGNSRDEMLIQLEGEELQIAFNPRYLLEAVRAIDDEFISMEFTTPLSPCIIRPVLKNNSCYLILPLRMG